MKNNKLKKIFPILIVIVMVLSALFALFYQLHNSVKIKPTNEYRVNENIVMYRQDDDSWAQDFLGESQYTMESSGCLVTCISSAVTMNGAQMTPGLANEIFSMNEVFDSEGNLQWEKVNEIEGYHAKVFTEASNEVIEECLMAGKYPIARVRMHGLGNFHYVLIVGAEDGEYICMDPLQDELTKLSAYGNRVYALRCVWYENTAATRLYEAFLSMEWAGTDYVYAYYDCDSDGNKELYLMRSDIEIPSGYIVKYQDGGLQYSYQSKVPDQYREELSWSELPDPVEAIEEKPEMTHSGIYVFAAQNNNGEGNYWYLDEASFLKSHGVDEAEPFYEYYDANGEIQLSLYYDEQMGIGCGIRYYERDPSTF